MDTKRLEELLNNIRQKAGEEISSQFADDLGLLITENEQENQAILQKDEQIRELTETKNNLITTNGNLLKQISMEPTNNPFKKEDKEKIEFNIYDAFDEKGNFK